MVPILSSAQIREADSYTIKNEPIPSIDLMERASKAFVSVFYKHFETGRPIYVIAGPGNNGGDALAIARILKEAGHQVSVWVCGNPEKASDDFKVNYGRIQKLLTVQLIEDDRQIPQLDTDQIVIEGLFGSGLSRPVEGLFAKVIEAINHAKCTVFSIDIPSGLFADQAVIEEGAIVRADHTISFQVPKLTFFHPSSALYVGNWHVVGIGLNQEFIDNAETDYFLTEQKDLKLPVRSRYMHKGTAGRVLLVSGSKGKMGAAVLSSRACLRSGAGLLFVQAPGCGRDILQGSVPEAMVLEDPHQEIISQIDVEDLQYDAIAIGPGIGTQPTTKKAFRKFLERVNQPVVFDADAINLLSEDSSLPGMLPAESILTPHPGEFKRLVGEWKDDFHKLELLKSFCRKHQVNMVLKGAHSMVCNSKGQVYFNSTGNPGMATGGSGDVLTGIIVALLGQGLSPFDALRTGVFVHGSAGDQAKEEVSEISIIASDLINFLPSAFRIHEK